SNLLRLRTCSSPPGLTHGCARQTRRRKSLPCSSRRSHPAFLPARSRRVAARLDQAYEEDDSNARLAVQCKPHGDGLHVEVLHPRRGWRIERQERFVVTL